MFGPGWCLGRLIAVPRGWVCPVEEAVVQFGWALAQQLADDESDGISHFLPLFLGILSARCCIDQQAFGKRPGLSASLPVVAQVHAAAASRAARRECHSACWLASRLLTR